jgi:hypothetical protein
MSAHTEANKRFTLERERPTLLQTEKTKAQTQLNLNITPGSFPPPATPTHSDYERNLSTIYYST